MPVSYTPFSGADLPLTLAGVNSRFQEVEDYFLAAIAAGQATQTTISAEAGEGLADRSNAYLDLSDNKIYLMDSDAAGPRAGTIRGFVDGTTLSGANATLVIGGVMDGFSLLTAWELVYTGSIAGTISQTRPAPALDGSQVMVSEMGFAIATDTLIVRPRPIQFQKRAAFSDNETLTVQHYSDEASDGESGYRRNIWAYFTEEEAGASLSSYSSTNYDSDVALQGNVPLTFGADVCTGGTASAQDANIAASNAFDNNNGTRWQGDLSGSVWLQYDFGVAVTKTPRRYTLRAYNDLASNRDQNCPRSWSFQGSNDGSNWTTLDSQTNVAAWTASEQRIYAVANGTAYRYVRWLFTASQGAAFIDIGEAEVFEGATFSSFEKLTQTFNLASTSTVASVSLYLKKTGSPAGTVTVRIETTSGGNPTGTLAHASASITLSESALTTSYALTTLTFASSFSLNAGDYAIVVSTSRSLSDTDFIYWGADGSSPGASGGEMKTYASATWSAASKDAVYTVTAPGTVHPSRVSVDWWSSTHADLVNRYGDGAGSSLSTQTTFKCLRDAGFADLTVVVELP